MKPQAITKALPTLFDAKQEPVREGVKKLAVSLPTFLVKIISEIKEERHRQFCHDKIPRLLAAWGQPFYAYIVYCTEALDMQVPAYQNLTQSLPSEVSGRFSTIIHILCLNVV